MSLIVVTILDGRGGRRDLELPGDVPLSTLGPAIAEAVHHPDLHEGDTPLKAVLKLEGSSEVLPLDQPLESVGIVHGDVLELLVKAIPEGIAESEVNLAFTGPGFVHPSGKTYPFRGKNVLIGRVDRASGVVSKVLGVDLTNLEDIEQPSISRRHARILLRDGEYLIQDLRSTNGTLVNGRMLEPESRFPLKHGAEVQFGDIALFFIWDGQEIEDPKKQENKTMGDLE